MVRLLFLMVACIVVVMGAGPIASVTSPGPVRLSGIEIQGTLLPSLPVVSGDEVATFDSPALILFSDRSKVFLGKNSRAKLDASAGQTSVHLLEGSLDFNATAGSGLQVFGPEGRIETPAGSKGSVVLGSNKTALGGIRPASGIPTPGIYDVLAPIRTAPPKSCPHPEGSGKSGDPRKDPGKGGGLDNNCGKGNGP